MSKDNEMVREYLSTVSPDMEDIPKSLLMNDLQGMGMDPQAPFMLLVESMSEDYLKVDDIRELTAPAPMELTAGDKALFQDLMEAVEPDQPVPVSLWKAQLSELELSQAHEFLTQLYDLHPEVELTRERVNRMAIESGLDVTPIPANQPSTPESHKVSQHDSTNAPELAEESAQVESGNDASFYDSPGLGMPNLTSNQSVPVGGSYSHTPPPTGPQSFSDAAASAPQYVADPGFAGLVSSGIYSASRLIGKMTRPLNPFSNTKADFAAPQASSNKLGLTTNSSNKRQDPVIGDGIDSPAAAPINDGFYPQASIDRARQISQKLRDGTATAAEVEQMTRELNHMGEQLDADEGLQLSAEDEKGLKEALLDMRDATGEQPEPSTEDEEKEKGRLKKAVEALIEAIKNLYHKIVNRSQDNAPSSSMAM